MLSAPGGLSGCGVIVILNCRDYGQHFDALKGLTRPLRALTFKALQGII